MHIEPYFSRPAEFRPYHPAVAEVARLVCYAIQSVQPELRCEHIGSRSVPGCGGKGTIDLAVLYPEGFLPRARAALDGLGFQKQGGLEPLPEERPLRVGSVEHGGGSFRIHAHVVALHWQEHAELIWFRDALRAGPTLRQRYERRKKAILELGIPDSNEYCRAKGALVVDLLKERQPAG